MFGSFTTTRVPYLKRAMDSLLGVLVFAVVLLGDHRIGLSQIPNLSPASNDGQWHLRYEIFQWLLEQKGLVSRTKMEDLLQSPKRSVVVLTGNLNSIKPETWNELSKFVSNGGNLLVASDQNCDMLAFGEIHSGPVTTARPEFQYERYNDCLKIRDLDATHSITNGLFEIVTNRSGFLSKPTDTSYQPLSERRSSGASSTTASKTFSWQTLSSLPTNCRPLASRGQPILAVCRDERSRQSGTAILSADASFFTNSMIWHADNGKLILNIANALCQGSRTQMVFSIDGKLSPSYRAQQQLQQLPQTLPPISPEDVPDIDPDLDTMLRFANLAIKKVGDSNIVNEALMKHPRNVSQPSYFNWVWRTLAALLTACIIIAVLRSKRVVPSFLGPRKMRSLYEIQDIGQHPLNRNQQAVLLLARDFCRQWTGKESRSDWKQCLQQLRPGNEQDAGRETHYLERISIQSIFEMAISGKTGLISDDYLEEMGRLIHRLLQNKPTRKG
jgi:hypothetical protein